MFYSRLHDYDMAKQEAFFSACARLPYLSQGNKYAATSSEIRKGKENPRLTD